MIAAISIDDAAQALGMFSNELVPLTPHDFPSLAGVALQVDMLTDVTARAWLLGDGSL